MGFLSKLFKKEVEEEPIVVEEVIDEVEQVRDPNEPICESCGLSISGEQRVKTFNGKKFHLKPCWRDVRKLAKAHAF